MTNPDVPSREAVEFSCRVVRETAQHLAAQGSTEAINLFGEVEHNLRTLLAEVERLRLLADTAKEGK